MYYQPLTKFPQSVLVEQYQRPVSNENVPKFWNVKLEFFTKEVNDLFTNCGLTLKDGEIFKKIPLAIGAIHSDIVWDYNTNFWTPWNCALNINLDNTDSLMYWYSASATPIFPIETIPSFNREKLNGIHYGNRHNKDFKNSDKFSLLGTLRLSSPTLLKTSVPHSVENTDNKNRWCISLRFEGNPSFYECMDKLKEWI